MPKKNFDLALILKDRRFLGIRLWMCALPLAFLAFIVFWSGLTAVAMSLFFTALVSAVIGFFVHLSRWRGPR
jgi:hypothetical protein